MPRSRSLEIFSDPATWAGEVLEVDLVKGEKGLGFSILDYQVLKVKDLLISLIIPKKCRTSNNFFLPRTPPTQTTQ